jgi:hypothetical protein
MITPALPEILPRPYYILRGHTPRIIPLVAVGYARRLATTR